MTRDCMRHGAATLLAALNIAAGEALGKTCRKHRRRDALRFLREAERTVPEEQESHVVLDNRATRKHEKALAWIEREKRVLLHFVPTSSSRASLVERFFAMLARKQVRRGVFASAPQLEKRLHDCLLSYNENPPPLVWTKAADEILEKVRRSR